MLLEGPPLVVGYVLGCDPWSFSFWGSPPPRHSLSLSLVMLSSQFLFPTAALMFLLGILDFLFVNHAYHSILTRGASVQLVFGFEVGHGFSLGTDKPPRPSPGTDKTALRPGPHSLPRSSSPQYAILMTMVLTIFIKYVLHSIDLQNENPWDSKAVYMLYTELFTGPLSSFPLFSFRPTQFWGWGWGFPAGYDLIKLDTSLQSPISHPAMKA